MKKYYLFIALAMVAAMTVSCKNNKKAEADAEVVEAAKTILADDVLAQLDGIVDEYIKASEGPSFAKVFQSMLTEEEKQIKPDYLLDPAVTKELLTKTQKVNALAILLSEMPLREAYDLPVEESKAAIAALIADLNHPLTVDSIVGSGENASEVIRKTYAACKERGDVAYFWQFTAAMQRSIGYLVSQNPEPYFRNINEEQYAKFSARFATTVKAMQELAKYDDEIATVETSLQRSFTSFEEAAEVFGTLESGKQQIIACKDIYAAQRAALLK